MSTQQTSLSPPATLAEVLDRILSLEGLARQRRQDLLSALRQVARLVGGFPADVPADPEALKRALELLTPAAAGMAESRFRNVRALLTAALDLTGAKVMRRRRHSGLAPRWAALLGSVSGRYERARLSRFFSFASVNGVEPDAVDDEVIAKFAEHLKRNSLIERQTQIVRDLCLAWNRSADGVPGWPETRLTVPDRRRTYALPESAYPPTFGADIEAYLAHLAGGDLFDSTGRSPASPTTLRDVRLRVFQMAAALVHSGRARETIRSLADLVEPDAVKTALKFFHSRNGKRKTGQLHNFALGAIKIAKWWVKAPPEQVEAIQAIRREVDPKETGMTARNRARLRQFDDPENLRRLLDLPEAIMRALPRSASPSYDQAIRTQSALAIAILQVAPMRMKNLASLRLGEHVVQARPGGARHIVVPPEQVKNKTRLAFEVSAALGAVMDVYLARCRPLLGREASGFLFPARRGGPKTPAELAAQIKRTIRQETGIDLNAHAFRHLAALLFLREYPGEYETARQFLGHKSITTTVRAYCGLEQADALRRLDALIDRHRNNKGKAA
jgi:integrase